MTSRLRAKATTPAPQSPFSRPACGARCDHQTRPASGAAKRGIAGAVAFLLVSLMLCTFASAQLKPYEGKYYVIRTDLTGDALREAELRMTKMAEEYRARTRDFAGTIGHKFAFHLFKQAEDYYAAGGIEGSAGYFDRNTDTLVAIAGDNPTAYTWSVVQHEGFHQFAASVIGGEIPIWVNEGLAEYFGEGIFTGDGFVIGVIPPERLERVQQQIRAGKRGFKSIKEMMLLPHSAWNAKLSMANYDQAWSMVQFLAHGDGGKYQKAFASFMRDLGTGLQWPQAWQKNFGTAEGFEEKWKTYWLELPANPTADLYARALLETMTSVLGRATAQRQRFASFDELGKAVEGKTLKIDDRDWLPPRLVSGAFAAAKKWRGQGVLIELTAPSGAKLPALSLTMKDGTKLTGKFVLKNGRVDGVEVK